MSRALIEKYDRPGPRYTSYPTVPYWTRGFSSSDYAAKLDEAGRRGDDAPLSLYFHLPFCESMCSYCGCNVVIAHNPERHVEYVDVLCQEIDLVCARLGNRRSVLQLHYGGGTPTYLSEALLCRIWAKITDNFVILDDAEVAVEIDPVVTTPEKVALLREMGFNRLSMGVQDFNPQVQEAVGRIQTVERTAMMVNAVRSLGFSGINFDLIYGLPYQDHAAMAHTIAEVITLGPDRVALYSYAHVPHLRPHQKRLDEMPRLNGIEKWELFDLSRAQLQGEGYVAIGMDHFARRDDELAIAQHNGTLSRNFQGYTVKPCDDIIAFGITGISDVCGAYSQNMRPLPTYYKAIRSGQLPTVRGCVLSSDDLLRRAAITRLMCHNRLDIDAITAEFQVSPDYFDASLAKLAPLMDDALVEVDGQIVTVTELGTTFIRNIAMAFDAYLDETEADGRPRFSQTI